MGPRRAGAATATGEQFRPVQFGGGLLWLAVAFLVLALVAGLLGARGVAGLSTSIAKSLVIVFLVLAGVSSLL